MKERVEAGFEGWGRWVGSHPWLVIALCGLAVVSVAAQARHVTMDFTPDSFLDERHHARLEYDAMRRQFSSDSVGLVVIEAADIWTLDFLTWLRALHEAMEERVPHLDEVTSLVNARSTRGEADSLIVEDLMEEWPETAAEVEVLRERALANAFYDGLLIAPEANMTVMLVALDSLSSQAAGGASLDTGGAVEVDFAAGFDEEGEGRKSAVAGADELPFLTGNERDAATQAMHAVLRDFPRAHTEIYFVGIPVIAEHTMNSTRENTQKFTLAAIGIIMVVLALLFRRTLGVVLPIAVSLCSIAVTFGAAGIRGSPLGVTTQMIPSMLLAVATSSSIHLLVLFFQNRDAGRSARESVVEALGHSGLPIVLASITTAGGLSSFNAANLAGLRDVGLLAPIGIFAGLVLTLTLLPAMLVVVPTRPRAAGVGERSEGPFERILVAVGDFSTGRPLLVAASAMLVTLAVGAGAFRLEYVFDPLTFLKEGDSVRVHTEYVGQALGTVANVDVIVDSGRPQGLQEPEMLAALDAAAQRARALRGGTRDQIEVGKVVSYIDIVKEIHQALNENRPEFYAVPDDRLLAAQELLLFENTGADDLEDFVDPQFRTARVTLRVPWFAASAFGNFLPDTESLFREELGSEVDVHLTGLMPLMSFSQEEMRIGLTRSYTLAILIITPLMMLLIGSVRGGLVSMVPNLMPIALVLGIMGWVGLELSVFTMMIGCIAIGLAVDDTIHIIHQFYRYLAVDGDPREAVRRTMRTTGRALMTTSIVLSLGFIVYTMAGMRNLEALGYVTTGAILLAFLADIVVAPALLALVSRGRGDARGESRS